MYPLNQWRNAPTLNFVTFFVGLPMTSPSGLFFFLQNVHDWSIKLTIWLLWYFTAFIQSNKDLITQYHTKIEGYHDRSLLLCSMFIYRMRKWCVNWVKSLHREKTSWKFCISPTIFQNKSQNRRIVHPFWDKNGKIMGKIQYFLEIFPVQDLNDQLFSLKRRTKLYSILDSLNHTLYTTMDSNIL